MDQNEKQTFDEWALLELFGHKKIVGRVTETTLAGGAFLRVDVPAMPPDQAVTRYFNPSSIYSVTPMTEEAARALLVSPMFRNEPVSRYDFPQIEDRQS